MHKALYSFLLIVILSFIAPAFSTAVVAAESASSVPAGANGSKSRGLAIFSENCIACHTMGVEDEAVPDLKGVTGRRSEAWLKSFIHSPSKVIASKDPIAMELLAKYKEPMGDPGLTPEDVDAVVEYLERMDTEIKPAQASAAIPDEVVKKPALKMDGVMGKALFLGEQRFLHGGAACTACHSVRSAAPAPGGHLAKELATAYSRLGETRMRSILEKSPFPLMREAYGGHSLTADEISDLSAFLEQAEKNPDEELMGRYGDAMLAIGLAGCIALLGCYGVFWSNRRSRSVNKDIYDRQTKSEDER